ncbi:helix-turn-helix transcriptional regulator [Lactobacillus acetotolerans]|uniref:helix-turn-helix domain-containing protein n=1 Tax=Lactobacillus acetotolerans TaxID=1600 RepID=UPI002FD95E5C
MDKQGVMLKADEFTELMKSKHLTVYKLSDLTGLAPSTIYRSLDSESPTSVGGETIAKLSLALGLSEDEFSKIFIFRKSLQKSNSKEVVE